MMKRCPRCGITKPRTEFYTMHSGRRAGKPYTYCKACDVDRPSRAEYLRTRWRTHQPKKFLPHVKRVEDIRGQVFGNYTVLEFAGLAPTNRVSKWLCRCVCGAEHVVFKTALRPGHIYCPTCHLA